MSEFHWNLVGVPSASSGMTRPLLPAGEEDVGRHADHPAGHDGAGRLRRLAELHPQSIVRVGQVQRVGRLPEQAQPGQETGQPAGDGALLLQRERRWGCRKRCWGGPGIGGEVGVATPSYDVIRMLENTWASLWD